jgi:multicomponent K+:H+ antiporter subunit D
MNGMNHWLIAPIVLPLLAGGLLLLLERSRSALVRPLSLAATLALLPIAGSLLLQADSGTVQAYLLGNWAAPFGIALAFDRLSALMLLLTALVANGALLFACGGQDRQGAHFHALWQFQLMGLNGAFLTADLFNLFVFFEVLLAASYGLLLHGAGQARVKAGLHYVVFNLTGSGLFLIAVSLLYALTGTLNFADLSVKLAALPPENLRLAQAALLLLAVVFGVKAALLPLYFWLPAAYAAAPAATAALFAIMTKVGVYSLTRTQTLLTRDGALDGLIAPALPALALATVLLGALAALGAARLRGLVAALVVVSAGTLLLSLGLQTRGALAAGLFYLVPSTLVTAALFLLAERIVFARGGDESLLPKGLQSGGSLGLLFMVAAIAVAGLPPLGGFLGKALLLQAALNTTWAMPVLAVLLGAGLLAMVSLARAGSRLFWKPAAPAALLVGPAPRAERTAPVLLLLACLAVVPLAGPLSRYTEATAAQLHQRGAYVQAVLGEQPVPPAYDVRKEMRERGELK